MDKGPVLIPDHSTGQGSGVREIPNPALGCPVCEVLEVAATLPVVLEYVLPFCSWCPPHTHTHAKISLDFDGTGLKWGSSCHVGRLAPVEVEWAFGPATLSCHLLLGFSFLEWVWLQVDSGGPGTSWLRRLAPWEQGPEC